MRVYTCLFVSILIVASPAQADNDQLVERYFTALQMQDVFEILHDEGVASSVELAESDNAISVSPAWTARIEKIYSVDRMDAAFRHAVKESETLVASEDALAFFESDLGRRVVQIELDARKVLGEDGVEDQMRIKVEQLEDDDPARFALYRDFVGVNDLVDSNVMGALNSNLAFYQGLASNPEYGEAMSEGFMLSQVWEQEPEIREDMEDWTMNFSTLAYSVLTSEEMQEYIDISSTPAGQALNTVLFAGFDQVFEMQSYELGRAMADFALGDDT